MPIEMLIDDYNKQKSVILDAMKKQSEILEKIKKSGTEDYDWISVKTAANLLDVSVNVIYDKVNSGKFSVKHIKSKVLVRKSEFMAIDDKYEGV